MVDEAEDVLTDPRLIRRNISRSGYNTRRSASESNNRSAMYFSEVDVDVRTTRATTRGDVQDFSHIKSSEDISSGYSSADNSAAMKEQVLSRTASVGATCRSKTKQIATRSTITTIKRPGAAEGSEVIIEELHDNENFDYTNLPPLLNLPPTCHISQTNPPFIFEYVGNQIKIIQMLGDLSQNCVSTETENNTSDNEKIFVRSSGESDTKFSEELKESLHTKQVIPVTHFKDVSNTIIPPANEVIKDNENIEICKNKSTCQSTDDDESTTLLVTIKNEVKLDITDIEKEKVGAVKNLNREDYGFLSAQRKQSNSMTSSSASLNSAKTSPSIGGLEDSCEVVSLETSSINDDAVETDDEASYGTPEDSPKPKKKHIKCGKYGKSKAPPPPPKKYDTNIIEESKMKEDSDKNVREDVNLTINKGISPEKQIKFGIVKDVGPIQYLGQHSEISHGHISKRKCRQKSPAGRKINIGSSPITRLMQLPGKFAFWHKTDDNKSDKTDIWTSSSDDECRSSVDEKAVDNFQSCVDLKEVAKTDNSGSNIKIPTLTVSDSVDRHVEEIVMIKSSTISLDNIEETAIAKDIIDKSDALQKLIDAKLESHPEYKIVSLHDDEIPTTSKSTEV